MYGNVDTFCGKLLVGNCSWEINRGKFPVGNCGYYCLWEIACLKLFVGNCL